MKSSCDVMYRTPQWSAFCASVRNSTNKSASEPEYVVDKSVIVVDPVSNRRFYVCRPTSDRVIYRQLTSNIKVDL